MKIHEKVRYVHVLKLQLTKVITAQIQVTHILSSINTGIDNIKNVAVHTVMHRNSWLSVYGMLLVMCLVVVVPALSKNLYVVQSGNISCDLSMFDACGRLQELSSENNYSQENITLLFSPGHHFLEGGISLSGIEHAVLKGQLSNVTRPPNISCKESSCFVLRNVTGLVVENINFVECASKNQNGAALFVQNATYVSITNCSFINNFVPNQYRGGAIRIELAKNIHILRSQFFNNSAICEGFAFLFCTVRCLGSSGAVSIVNSSLVTIEQSLFDYNTAYCVAGAIGVAFTDYVKIIDSRFLKNVVYSREGLGGAILVSDTLSVEIARSYFENNTAYIGGAIFAEASPVSVFLCFFMWNTAGFSGGAVYAENTNVAVMNSSFLYNYAASGGALALFSRANENSSCIFYSIFAFNTATAWYGGALVLSLKGLPRCSYLCHASYNITGVIVLISDCVFKSHIGSALDLYRGVVSISKSIFERNYSEQLGGAITSNSNHLYLSNNTFSGNYAVLGGFLYMSRGTIETIDNVYRRNVANSVGGAMDVINCTVSLSEDVFSGNIARANGAAISALVSRVFLSKCAFLRNMVPLVNGGAICVSNGSLNSTLSVYDSNYANLNGGAIFLSNSLANLTMNLFYNNTASFGEGAAIFQSNNKFYLSSSVFVGNQALDVSNMYVVQLINIQGFCDDLSFSGNHGALSIFHSVLNFSGAVSLTNNTAVTGGALSLVQSTVTFEEFSQITVSDNTALFGSGIFLSETELRIYTSSLSIIANTANISGGAIFGYQSQISITVNDMQKSIVIARNEAKQEGGAVHAIATSFKIEHGFTQFDKNMAQKGGAFFLSENSKIYIQKTVQEKSSDIFVKLTLSNNSANYGGTIFVADASNTGVLCEQSMKRYVRSISSEDVSFKLFVYTI